MDHSQRANNSASGGGNRSRRSKRNRNRNRKGKQDNGKGKLRANAPAWQPKTAQAGSSSSAKKGSNGTMSMNVKAASFVPKNAWTNQSAQPSAAAGSSGGAHAATKRAHRNPSDSEPPPTAYSGKLQDKPSPPQPQVLDLTALAQTDTQQLVNTRFPKSSVTLLDIMPFLPRDERLAEELRASSQQASAVDEVDDRHSALLDEVEVLEFICADLATLLRMDYVRFWSQVLHDDTLHRFTDSFLANASRNNHGNQTRVNPKDHVATLHADIKRRVLHMLLRMSVHDDQLPHDLAGSRGGRPAWHMTPEEHGAVLYDFWIFDVTKLMDICSIFYPSNPKVTSALVKSVFAHQPQYWHDLHGGAEVSALGVLFKALTEITARFQSSTGPGKQTTRELRDIVTLFQDLCTHALCLAQALPEVVKVYNELTLPGGRSLMWHLAMAYEVAIPLLANELKVEKVAQDAELQLLRLTVLELATVVMEQAYLLPLKTSNDKQTIDRVEEALVATCQQLGAGSLTEQVDAKVLMFVSKGCFFKHLERHHNVCQALREARRRKILANSPQIDYVLGLFSAPQATPGHGTDQKKASSSSKPSASVQDSIKAVRELFPDFSEDFARDCLANFQWSHERTINAVLENNLPPTLRNVKNRRAYVSSAADSNSGASSTAVDDTPEITVWQDEEEKGNKQQKSEDQLFAEYLASTGRVARSAVPQEPVLRLNEFQDANEVERMKDVMKQMIADQYDDEYDDTYDEFLSYDMDAIEEDDERLNKVLSTSTTATAGQGDSKDEEEEEEDDEDDEKSGGSQKLRRNRNQTQAGKSRKKKWGPDKAKGGFVPKRTTRPKVDLTVRTAESLRARQRKAQNKGRSANHSRKSRALRKMAHGM